MFLGVYVYEKIELIDVNPKIYTEYLVVIKSLI